MRIGITLLLVFASLSLFGQTIFQKPFEDCNVKGSITIYDLRAKKWLYSDSSDSKIGTLPASTFKIINTLIVLETGVIGDENEVVKWPGVTDTIKYGYRPDIYHDMNIREAFRLSAGWVYVELAKKIEKQQYKTLLASSGYGNADVSIDDPDFWNFGELAISPINQIEILVGIHKETLPFSKRSFKVLKELMTEEQTNDYTLRAKTGWTRSDGKDTGWWVGYVERKDNVYFFATRLIKDRITVNPNFGKCRKDITKKILRQLRIIE